MRETAERGDKSRPKPALSSTHAGNGKEKKKNPVFSLCASQERSPHRAVTWWKRSDVCKVLQSLLWWFTRSKHNYNQREYLYLRGAQLRLMRSRIAFLFELWLVWRSYSATPSVRCRWRGSSCASIKCSLFLPCYHVMGVTYSGLKAHEVEQATWIIDWQSPT